jgi:tRNA(Ile2) C34 agmatinyltransferase TiaS
MKFHCPYCGRLLKPTADNDDKCKRCDITFIIRETATGLKIETK